MAPGLLDTSLEVALTTLKPALNDIPKNLDPYVALSPKAPAKTKELWAHLGHPYSLRYNDPTINSIPALVRRTARAYPDQPAFLYPTSNKPDTPYDVMNWAQFDAVTDAMALKYGHLLKELFQDSNAARQQPTIALLGRGTTLDFFVTEIALVKLGARVLLLAAQNSIQITDDLIQRCNASALITDSRHVVKPAKDIPVLAMIEDLTSLDWNVSNSSNELRSLAFDDGMDPWDRQVFIIHSSGSTGAPKPIKHSNRSVLIVARMYRLFPEFHIDNWYMLFPLYHVAGIFVTFGGMPHGLVTTMPPIDWPPSSSAILASLETVKNMGFPVDCVHCAPTLIANLHEYITENTGDWTPLSTLRVLQPGGAMLSEKVVKSLISHGVNMKSTYGSTEIGPPFRSLPHTRDNPNCYSFRNLWAHSDKIKMEEVGEGLYECIIYKGFPVGAELWEERPADEPFRTNDLFIQDPPSSGNYVLMGRRDDILVHSNGNNTAAGQMQMDLQEELAAIASRLVMIGHTRPCVALLVQVKDGIDHSNPETLESIWVGVEVVNSKSPTHSRIIKSMIYLVPTGQDLPVTPKGNVKRKATEEIFSANIERLYAQLEGDEDTIAQLSESTSQPLIEIIRELISKLTGAQLSIVKNSTNLYDLGFDSQLAISLRSSLLKLVGPISLGTIFENASVEKLVAFFEAKRGSSAAVADTTIPYINQTIEKFSAEVSAWPPPASNRPVAAKEVILLTGASGSLGVALVDALTASVSVTKVYALVRGPDHEAKMHKQLETRGVDLKKIITSGKLVVLPYTMKDPLLGLDVDTYQQMTRDVTIILHNAWNVNFNQSVQDFEIDCLRGTLYLLRFATATTYTSTFAFTSSVSTHMGAGHLSKTPVLEAVPSPDPSIASNLGYAQGKYIIERLLSVLSPSVLLSTPIRIFRVGQLCGHSSTGLWNTSDMFPIMFATSAVLGSLPNDGALVDWLPVDVAAQTMVECLLIPSNQSQVELLKVHNVVNPHSIPWSTLAGMFAHTLSSSRAISLVPMSQWVTLLSAAAVSQLNAADVPGLKLLGFFEDMAAADPEKGERVFETGATQDVSTTLRNVGSVSEEWLNSWILRWKDSGFIIT